MSAARLRALLFDWGGVLQRTVDRGPRRDLAAELGISEQALEEAVFGAPPWEAASLGRLSADAAWAAIVAAVGWEAGRVDEFVERFFAGDVVDEALVALIRALRAAGTPVGLLSNALPDRAGAASRAGCWGMAGLFDAQVFSYQVGALKPDPATYRAALEALGAHAAETLFVDDAPANVAGARAVGLQAHLFVGPEALRRELAAWGLQAAGT